MLDGLAIHVAHIKRAVRAGGEKHWAEPVVRRGEEFADLVGHARGECRSDGCELVPMNQVTSRITGESVTAILGGQRIASVNMNATSSGEGAGVRVGGRQVIADRIQARREVLVRPADEVGDHGFRHVLRRFGQRQVRVARQVARRNDCVLNMHTVHAMKTVSGVVERLPELPAPADRFNLERERIEPRVGADLDGGPLGMLGRGYLAHARQTAGEINPAVWAKGWMTDA